MKPEQLPQLILTIVVLVGFAIFVLVYMFVDLADKNVEVVKTILTSAGTACLLVLGFWFKPN